MLGVNQNQAESLDLPEGQVAVAAFRRRKPAEDYALVILAMKLPYWLHHHEKRYYLCVENDQAEAALEQLERYHKESRGWPSIRSLSIEHGSAHPVSLVIYALILMGFFYAQEQIPNLDRKGMMDTFAISKQTQWWRPITALTLHADIGHLAGNVLSGICFGLLINRIFGYGLGWLLIILSGALGNLMTLWVHLPQRHLALGASTAIFGALGILVGHAVVTHFVTSERGAWKRSVIPIIGGLTVLGLTGLAGDNVDISGHVCGFIVGSLFGLTISRFALKKIPDKAAQAALGVICLVLLTTAWIAALTKGFSQSLF
ncbi:rhomboid family intramembrane serine protease [Rubellicoccus peritrichatus]|uniref:Rhomboid family intramembrane serine protease n=1 Tax=Rubellicoccus peritrichatus TaxID=3080537 RepID=A0AAQ3QW65_9BACT|nr:rhomboid family intramembrane serine protease [Puniceicoccus sp. CR14]WOO41595.1 rhomboid family intramembrane serine protease [Puniceicoccus sp. CR14]